MAAVAPTTDRILNEIPALETADLLENLSLDSQAKPAEAPEPTKKIPSNQYGTSNSANNMFKPFNRSTTPLHVDPNAYYYPGGFPSPAPYYGGFDGHGNDWNDYSGYLNADGMDMSHGIYGDSGNFMYPQGYGYSPFGTYPPDSAVPTMGHDYGTQQYQYPSPFYQHPSSNGTLYSSNQVNPSQGEAPNSAVAEKVSSSVGTIAENPNNVVNSGNVNRINGPKPYRPNNLNVSSNLNNSYKKGSLPSGFSTSSFQDPRYGFDGYQSPLPWMDSAMYSNGPSRPASNGGYSSTMNSHPTRPTSAMGQAPGYMNLVYPNSRIYGQYGNRTRTGFGSFPYNTWMNGHGWVDADNKYKSRARIYGAENMEGLCELNRGPRSKGFKNQKESGTALQTVDGQNQSPDDNNKEEDLFQVPDKEQFNKESFTEEYLDAKFFVIKSYSEDDVHKCIKYGVWTSTPNGNKKLDAAYQKAKEVPRGCPIFLLFSVNTSGQFVGLAEMVGPVDFDKTVEYWQQEKWVGCFPVKWHIVKDIPNSAIRHITLENNENKPVTNSRDTQEVNLEQGLQIIKIFKGHKSKASILDDFGFYAVRERKMQEKKAKQKMQKQVLEGKPGEQLTEDKEKSAVLLAKEKLPNATVDGAKVN